MNSLGTWFCTILFSIIVSSTFGQPSVDSLQLVYNSPSLPDSHKSEILIRASKSLLKSNPDTSLFLIQDAFKLSDGSEELRDKVILVRGSIFSRLNRTDEAIHDFEEFIRYQKGDTTNVASYKAFNNLAICYRRIGQFESALFFYQKAYNVAERLQDVERMNTVLMNFSTF
ncbi:MAG: tetratricopeptide repeat protein, partial [Bacteroidota bacterium]